MNLYLFFEFKSICYLYYPNLKYVYSSYISQPIYSMNYGRVGGLQDLYSRCINTTAL